MDVKTAVTHTDQGAEDTLTLDDANARWVCRRNAGRTEAIQVMYPSNVWASCRPVRRQPGAPGLSVHVFNVNQYRSNHLARNHPRKEPGPIRRPKPIYISPAHYPRVKRSTKVQLPVLQPTNARSTPEGGTAFLINSGGRYKRHAA